MCKHNNIKGHDGISFHKDSIISAFVEIPKVLAGEASKRSQVFLFFFF